MTGGGQGSVDSEKKDWMKDLHGNKVAYRVGGMGLRMQEFDFQMRKDICLI